MNFASTLVALAGLAGAVDVQSKTEQSAAFEIYPSYFENPYYRAYDYGVPYDSPLPSANFNENVYKYNEDTYTFSQEDYEQRVKLEAELMISLEAQK